MVWDYKSFGKLAANTNNSIEVFSRFPGQYLDSETGLYYNYFRDYDPSIGRYIESDPIGLEGGINTYGYAYQNPITHYDPDGRLVFLIAAPAFTGGVSGGTFLSGGLALVFAAWASTWDDDDASPECPPTNDEPEPCSEEIAHCNIVCERASRDFNQPNVWGGSFSVCMDNCVSSRCK